MRFRLSKQFLVALALVALAAVVVVPVSASGLERWLVITLDREDYYWVGAPNGPNGQTEVSVHRPGLNLDKTFPAS